MLFASKTGDDRAKFERNYVFDQIGILLKFQNQ